MRTPFDNDDAYPVTVLQNKPFLFIEYRVDPASVPEGMYMYEVADGDGDGCFARVQKNILCNFWGTIIGPEPLELPEDGVYYPTYGSYEYEGCFGYFKTSKDDEEELDGMTAYELKQAWQNYPSQFASDPDPVDDPYIALLPGQKYQFTATLAMLVKTSVCGQLISYTPTEDIDDASLTKYRSSLKEALETKGLIVDEIHETNGHTVSVTFTVGNHVVRNQTVRDAVIGAGYKCGIDCNCGCDDIIKINTAE